MIIAGHEIPHTSPVFWVIAAIFRGLRHCNRRGRDRDLRLGSEATE